MEDRPKKRSRGGNTKRDNAPTGFYTPAQAVARLGFNRATFYYYVKKGVITRYTLPPKKEGFFKKEEIDRLATEAALLYHTYIGEKTETRPARKEDAQGIYDVLASFGWPTAPVALRLAWYERNPYIDYVVRAQGTVQGYITAVPYTPEALEAMMAGRKRAWDITPDDILPYQTGEYDLYTGIAVRQDTDFHTRYALRLIAGFLAFLEELGKQGIRVRSLSAVSDQPAGQKLSRDIGFVEQPAQPGDRFPRFILDLETSDSHFARRYREAINEK